MNSLIWYKFLDISEYLNDNLSDIFIWFLCKFRNLQILYFFITIHIKLFIFTNNSTFSLPFLSTFILIENQITDFAHFQFYNFYKLKHKHYQQLSCITNTTPCKSFPAHLFVHWNKASLRIFALKLIIRILNKMFASNYQLMDSILMGQFLIFCLETVHRSSLPFG